MTLSATARAIPSRDGTVAEPMCGRRTHRGASRSLGGTSGSFWIDVEAGRTERACLERVGERLRVDERAPRGVDEQSFGPDQLELASADQVTGLVAGGRVDADDVGGGEQLVELDRWLAPSSSSASGLAEGPE